MYFYALKRREEPPDSFRALRLSLNTPVVAIGDFPVGPARAGIALWEAPDGVLRLRVAVRSLRTGQVICFAPDERLEADADSLIAVDAALSFAEGMGFLFDEDEVATRGNDDAGAVAALWREIAEEDRGPISGWHADAPPPRSRRADAPVLDLMRESPVQRVEPPLPAGGSAEGDEVALEDIAIPGEEAAPAAASPHLILSKFRLVMGAAAREGRAEHGAPPGPGAGRTDEPVDSRIRLLSRF